jgi:hypothetical protein
MPGFVLVGSSPTFFKMPITEDLAQCVESGKFPLDKTTVTGHIPVIPCPSRRLIEGMVPLDNRRAILKCYESFKKFVV